MGRISIGRLPGVITLSGKVTKTECVLEFVENAGSDPGMVNGLFEGQHHAPCGGGRSQCLRYYEST